MKSFIKNMKFIPAILAVAAIYAGCTKGPDLKTYEYPAPEPTGMFPSKGYPGIDVTINGAQFGDYKNAVKVFFNGIAADTIRSIEDGKIVVKVPADVVSGKVSLQIWNHSVDSIGSYTVVPFPMIKTVDNTAGLPGDTIRISGINFGSEPSRVHVSFSGAVAEVSDLMDTLITVVVPPVFESGNIVLTVDDYTVNGPLFARLVSVPSPIYWLPFDGDFNDKMGGTAATYTKGLAGDTSFVPGVNGRAVYLPGWANDPKGNNQIIALPPQITKHRELTIACWVNWENAAGRNQEPIFDAGQARGTRLCLMTRMSSGFGTGWQNMIGRLAFENVKDAAGNVIYGTPPTYYNAIGTQLSKNEWHHVAYVLSYANQYEKIYLDGKEVGSVALDSKADPLIFNHNKVYIGAPTNGSDREPTYNGSIDNFRIYNQVLTAEQIYTDSYKK